MGCVCWGVFWKVFRLAFEGYRYAHSDGVLWDCLDVYTGIHAIAFIVIDIESTLNIFIKITALHVTVYFLASG